MYKPVSGTTHFRNVRVKHKEIVFDAPDVGYGVLYSNTFLQGPIDRATPDQRHPLPAKGFF
jgi:hypothetical protein